jgi:hypothetical protein
MYLEGDWDTFYDGKRVEVMPIASGRWPMVEGGIGFFDE